MEAAPEFIPCARLFIGPGHKLFGFDRIWVVLHQGRPEFIGKNGDDKQDEKVLSYVLGLDDEDIASSELFSILTEGHPSLMPSNKWQDTPNPNAALKGDTPLIWTVDFDQDRLLYDRDGLHLMYQFNLPELPLRLRHLQPYVPTEVPSIKMKPSSTICSWSAAPRDVIPQQLFDLVYRIVSDYEHNWRKARFTTKHYGLQPLAMGLLSCFTLNFIPQKVCANHLYWNTMNYRSRLNPENLLRWRAWPTPPVVPTVCFGHPWKMYVLFTEKMGEAMSLVYEHFVVCSMMYDPGTEATYIVTSIREIQYFTVMWNSIKCTPIETFLDGQNPPSKTAVRWMLNAIHGHEYPLATRIHKLPLELQEMILNYSADGSEINRAFYASILGVGIPFEWKSGNVPLKLQDLRWNRNVSQKVPEHQILFWNDFVGLSYQVETTPEPDS